MDYSDYNAEVTDEQIILELGQTEMAERIRNLSSYQRYDTIANYKSGGSDVVMTTAQMKAWAAFATTLGDAVVIQGASLLIPKSPQEMVQAVLRDERNRLADLQRLRERWDAGEEIPSYSLDRLRAADPVVDAEETAKAAAEPMRSHP